MMKLDNYSKEELAELIITYNEYQKECPKDEQLSIGSFVLSNAIAKSKYKDNEEEYEKNKYPIIKTIEDRLKDVEKREELRTLFNKPRLYPRFRIRDFVEDIVNKQYYQVRGQIIKKDNIVYILKNGPVEVELEEKYLRGVVPINGISTKDGIIITEAKRK